jgi:hypothetical protein
LNFPNASAHPSYPCPRRIIAERKPEIPRFLPAVTAGFYFEFCILVIRIYFGFLIDFCKEAKNQSNAQAPAKNSKIFKNFQSFRIIFQKFSIVSRYFSNVFEYFRTQLAHLMRGF